MPWGERVQRADRVPVVAELAVVVVLYEHRAAAGRPFGEPPPTARAEGSAERELVRGSQQRRGGIREHRVVGHRSVGVDRHRRQAQARAGDDPAVFGQPERLGRDCCRAPFPQHAAEQGQPVLEPGAYHDPLRADGDATHPGEVPGEGLTQFGHAARVRVFQCARGGRVEGLARRGQPVPPREGRQVGDARMQ